MMRNQEFPYPKKPPIEYDKTKHIIQNTPQLYHFVWTSRLEDFALQLSSRTPWPVCFDAQKNSVTAKARAR